MGKARRFAAWMAALLLSTTAWAGYQKAPKGAELVKKIDEIFEPWNKPGMPGGVVAVVQGGEMVFSKGYGLANVELGVPNNDKTVFDIGSTSKQFTAACVMLLAEQGKIDIDEPVAKFFPGFSVLEEYKITPRQMMAHTSGLRDFVFLLLLKGKVVWDDEDVLDVLQRQRTLNFAPDTNLDYSNTGYFLLGEVVERISGQSLAEFAKENLFNVLGMGDTMYQDDATQLIPNRAFGYLKNGRGELVQGLTLVSLDGPGGVWTTVGDMMKWTENFKSNKLGKGNSDFFEPLQSKHRLPSGSELSFGLGFRNDDLEGVPRIQHGGDFVGFHSRMSCYPDQDLAVYTFGNDGTQLAKSLNDDVSRLMLGLETETTTNEVWLSESQLREYAGAYSLGSLAVVLKVKDGTLVIQPTGDPEFEMYCSKKDQFTVRATGSTVDFSRDGTGAINKVELTSSGQKHMLTETAAFALSEEDQAEITGRYYSFELDLILTIREAYGHMEAVVEAIGGPFEVEFATKTRAAGAGLALDFTWEDDGVESVSLDFPRAHNMVFQRMIS